MGFGEAARSGVEAGAGVTPDPVVLAAEPGAGLCVVEIGPAGVPEVSDVLALWAAVLARLLEPALLVLAAEAERGRSARTPAIALTGVALFLTVVFAIVLAVALTLYFTYGGGTNH